MIEESVLRAVPPRDLSDARAIAHQAAQLLTRAARANLAAAADDSHSNLGWDRSCSGFVSQPISHNDADIRIGTTFDPLRIFIIKDGKLAGGRDLDGTTVSDALTWLDTELEALGLKAASNAKLPYDLPPEVAAISMFDARDHQAAFATLSGWFAVTHDALTNFASRHAGLTPGPSPVRCWPHHFDIATYVSLETGDAETARGMGVGLSPGDESYDQPYIYINPWPHLGANDLPSLPPPGHWHTQGFVGAIATGEAILANSDIAGLANYIDRTFDIGRKKLFQGDA